MIGLSHRLYRPLLPDAGAGSSGADIGGASDGVETTTGREGAAKGVAEVLGSVVVNDRIDARVGVRQTLPDNAHRLQINSPNNFSRVCKLQSA